MRILVACVSAALISVGPVSNTPVAAATRVSAPVSQTTAAELARTVEPLELVIPTLVEEARVAIVAIPTLHEDAKQLETAYPGLFATVWNDIKPEVQKYYEADQPRYWTELEKLYVSHLTENEAQVLLRYCRSPTGQRMTRTLAGGFDQSEILAKVAKTGSAKITSDQLDRAKYASKVKAVNEVGLDGEKDLKALEQSLDVAKFEALTTAVRKLKLAWINQQDAEFQEKLRELMHSAIDQHIAAHSTAESK